MMKCAHEGAPQRGRAVCRYNGRSDQTCARPYGLAGVQSVEWRGYGREGSHNAPHGQVHGPAPLIRRHPHLRPLELAREGPQEHLRARRRRESPTVAPPREGTPSTFRRGLRSRPNTCVCVCVCVCAVLAVHTLCSTAYVPSTMCFTSPYCASNSRSSRTHSCVGATGPCTHNPPPSSATTVMRTFTNTCSVAPQCPRCPVSRCPALADGSQPKAPGRLTARVPCSCSKLHTVPGTTSARNVLRLGNGESGRANHQPHLRLPYHRSVMPSHVAPPWHTALAAAAQHAQAIGTYRWSIFELGGCVLVARGLAREGVEAE